jgi:hypothetical protein
VNAAPAPAPAQANPPDPHQERRSPNNGSPRSPTSLRALLRTLIGFGRQLANARQHSTPATGFTTTNPPVPHYDRQSAHADTYRTTGHLLGLVRVLMDFGRHLATTLQQRTAHTDLTQIIRHFGTSDIALIFARITRGLMRATALETRLAGRRDRQPTAPSTPRQPRIPQPADRGATAAAADPDPARLPSPEEIAAEIRRRPFGAVIADICRDFGIVPTNPLWLELSCTIVANGGSFIRLFNDALKRVTTRPDNPPATEHPAGSALDLPFAVMPGTGPP